MNWVTQFTNTEKKLEVEPFSKTPTKITSTDFNGHYLIAERPQGSKKVNFALRLEEELIADIENCSGSKNAVINALLKYAINDIKEKKITVYL